MAETRSSHGWCKIVFSYFSWGERISLSDDDSLIPRTYRLPKSITNYLDSLQDKSAFVIDALKIAISEHQLQSTVIGRAKLVEQVEDQIDTIKEDPTYRDAVKGLKVLSIKDEKSISWMTGRESARTTKEKAERGWIFLDGVKSLSFTPDAFDRYHSMGKEYFQRIASDYQAAIQKLLEKRDKLKAEILKGSPSPG